MTDREQYAKNLELALQTAAKIDRGELSRKARKLGDGYGTEEAERHCKIMFAIFEELGSTSYDYLQGTTHFSVASCRVLRSGRGCCSCSVRSFGTLWLMPSVPVFWH